jgi:hypothetical protein
VSRARAVALALAVAGCIDDLDPKTLITAPRVVEILAEPPEVRAGEVSTLSVILGGTRGPATYRWSVCPITDLGALGSGASTSLADCFRDGAAVLPLAQTETAAFVLPPSVFASATEAARRFEGTLPAGIVDTFLREVGLAVPVLVEVQVDGRTLRALKRVVVSQNPTPNTNPPSPRVRINGRWVSIPAGATDRARCLAEDGAALEYGRGDALTLTPDPAEPWIERYTVLTADGRFAPRDEQAFYSWYATAGSLSGLTRSPLRDNVWNLPTNSPAQDHSLWILLRDGRGGASGCRVDLRVAR